MNVNESLLPADFSPFLLQIVLGVGIFVMLALLVAGFVAAFRGHTRRKEQTQDLPSLDVHQLPAGGPLPDDPQLLIYGIPVRLVALILAPVGRSQRLSAGKEVADILAAVIPQFEVAVAVHGPTIDYWPGQLSSQGFTHSFFNHVRLPEDRGKGTPWCCIAGRADAGSQQVLMGLVCCASSPNSLSQITIEHPGQWLDIVRVNVRVNP